MRLVLPLVLVALVSEAAPQPSYPQANNVPFQQVVNTMRREIANHESEISTLQERLGAQETTMELLREQLQKSASASADLESSSSKQLEATLATLVSDLQKLRNHSNDISDSLGKTQKRLSVLEAQQETQNRNISNLQAAVKSVLEAFDIKENPSGTYKVKNGDSLEKIAKLHRTTIAKLKELNGLKSDQIRVGQILKTP